jgi:ketosteroid isomerase-like protein
MGKNLDTISELYAEFGRGDIPAVLNKLADNVEWEVCTVPTEAQLAGVPWLQPQHGKEGAAKFFEIVGQFDFKVFDIISLTEGGNNVSALLRIAADTPGGGHFDDEEIHFWTFNEEGKISGYRHYMDSAPHIAAANGASSARGERNAGASA